MNAIAKTVFTQDDFLATVPSILRTVWQVMHSLHHHFDLTLEQQDIAGFYNAVPHSRALQSAQILIARFRRLQDLTDPNAFLSVSSQSATRLLDSSLSRQVEASSCSYLSLHSTACSYIVPQLEDLTQLYIRHGHPLFIRCGLHLSSCSGSSNYSESGKFVLCI